MPYRAKRLSNQQRETTPFCDTIASSERNTQMGNRPGLGYFYHQRLNSLMAIGESRHQAKNVIREASTETHWNVSTGKIHS
jgi:hypothetical protein